jgi:hypothetical protein
MTVIQGTKYAKYPTIGYLNGVPVRLVPDEVVFGDMWDDDEVEMHEPPFEGLTGNAATMGKVLMECEAAGLGKAVHIQVRKAKPGPWHGRWDDPPDQLELSLNRPHHKEGFVVRLMQHFIERTSPGGDPGWGCLGSRWGPLTTTVPD